MAIILFSFTPFCFDIFNNRELRTGVMQSCSLCMLLYSGFTGVLFRLVCIVLK